MTDEFDEAGSGQQANLDNVGDTLWLRLSDVSDDIEGDYGTYFFLTGEVLEGSVGDRVPAAGDEATYLFTHTRSGDVEAPVYKELIAALKRARVTRGLSAGDTIGLRLKDIQTHSKAGKKFANAFRNIGVVVKPAVAHDEFEDAPY